MFFDGNCWVVTAQQYMQEIRDGATGRFFGSKNSIADVPYKGDWSPNYEVSEVYLSAESRWVPATDVYTYVSICAYLVVESL